MRKENEMSERTSKIVVLLTVALLAAWAMPALADQALDKAFDALKTYDWGTDRNTLKPIDDAVVASHGDAAAQKALEMRLAAVLKSNVSRASKDYVCRKLSLIGSAACVPTVAELLPDPKLSHMARYALERIPGPESVAAMRDCLSKVKGKQKVGVINSLGVRRDKKSTAALVALLNDSDKEIAAAAAAALGAIGTPESAKALEGFQAKASKDLQLAADDACLACAEALLAGGHKAEAMNIYKTLSKSKIKHVRLAAMRGMLAAAGKK
jgi:hypothetical protein